MTGEPEDALQPDEATGDADEIALSGEADSTAATEADHEADQDGDLREFKYKLGKNLTRRIDQYLVDRIGYLSRNEIQRLIRDGLVKVNGQPTKPSFRPREHDVVEVSAPPRMIEQLVPENIPLEVLFEDDWMMALNKQADLIVHPARGQWTGTLVNGLAYYGSKWSQINGNWRPGILHRLDRNTTGVILIAKVDEAHWRLARQFENRTIEKTYLAYTHGIPQLLGDVIDMPIGQDRYVREKQAVRKIESGGRSAVTRYEVQKTLETPAGQNDFRFRQSAFANDRHYKTPTGRFSFLKLFPKTGRTHQLRVHLSHIGLPIVGDTMYGGQSIIAVDPASLHNPPAESAPAIGPSNNPSATKNARQEASKTNSSSAPDQDELFGFHRQALHAHEITFTHPISLEKMTITAPLPPDMTRLWELLDRSANNHNTPAQIRV